MSNNGIKYKCLVCGERKTNNLMELAYLNKTRRVCSLNCAEIYKQQILKKKQEKQNKEALVNTICSIHNISQVDIHKSFYSLLAEFRRNYNYNLINIAYRYNKKNIEWAIDNKSFKNYNSMLRYTFVIVKNNMK